MFCASWRPLLHVTIALRCLLLWQGWTKRETEYGSHKLPDRPEGASLRTSIGVEVQARQRDASCQVLSGSSKPQLRIEFTLRGERYT